MKQFILLGSLIFISILCSKAQSFGGGVLGGLVASQVDGDNFSGYNKIAPYGGFYISKELSDRITLQWELKYIGKGSNKVSNRRDDRIYKMRLNYAEIPFIVTYNTQIKLFFQGGLEVGYLFAPKEFDEYGEMDSDYLKDFKKLEYSYLIGLGYQLSEKLSGIMRFSYSILPIRDYKVTMDYMRGGQYNNVVTFGLQYSLGQ